MGQQRGRIKHGKDSSYKVWGPGERQKRMRKTKNGIRRPYVNQGTSHKIYKGLVTVLTLRIIIATHVHCYINSNYHNNFDDKIIIDMVLITMLISPLIMQLS